MHHYANRWKVGLLDKIYIDQSSCVTTLINWNDKEQDVIGMTIIFQQIRILKH